MNLAELRESVQALTGHPERGTSGTNRINTVINYAVRQIWSDLPDTLLTEEHRFKLEVPIDLTAVSVDANDPLVFIPTTLTAADSFATDGTLRARWLEVTRSSVRYYFRIRDVYRTGAGAPYAWNIVVDKPWDTPGQTGLSARIFTHEYPYPADVQSVDRLLYSPETNPGEILQPATRDEVDSWKWTQGWRESGQPTKYGRGDFYQLPAPHYKPVASLLNSGKTTQAWGFDGSGNEQVQYGPAGTFSYKVLHVWGRQKFGDNSQEGVLLPFYSSSPSSDSEQISTTWAGSLIRVITPDVDYVYGFGPNNALKSYHRHGTEKWIFRARHAVDLTMKTGMVSAGTIHERVEADGVYYLWKIVQGHETLVFDRGDEDPVDRRITIKDTHGHLHIRFDRLASQDDTILAMLQRRPATLQHDLDTPRLPPECYGPLVDLACAYLLGRRDGQADRESYYWVRYQEELKRLRQNYSTPGHDQTTFGDGLDATGAGAWLNRPIQEVI